MASRDRAPKPKWWQLYLTVPLLLGLFLLDTHLRLSTSGHEVVQLGSLLLEFGVVQLWLRANSRALRYMDDEEFSKTIHVYEIPPLEPTVIGKDAQRALPLPPIEIKGVLGNTFEMDYIDANSFNVDASSDASEKEQK